MWLKIYANVGQISFSFLFSDHLSQFIGKFKRQLGNPINQRDSIPGPQEMEGAEHSLSHGDPPPSVSPLTYLPLGTMNKTLKTF